MMNMFQVLSAFSDTAVDLLNQSFAFVGKLYGKMIELSTTTNARLLNDYLGGLVESFYVIAGLFMLFRISVSVFEYILEPDKMSDTKTGPGKLLTNIVVTVLLIMAFVPGGFVTTAMSDIEEAFLYDASGKAISSDDASFMSRILNKVVTDDNNSSKKKSNSSSSSSTTATTNYFHGLEPGEFMFANNVAGSFYSCNLDLNDSKNKKIRDDVYSEYINNVGQYVNDRKAEKNGFFSRFAATSTDDAEKCYQFEVAPLGINKAGEVAQDLIKEEKLDYYFFTGIAFAIALIVYLGILCVEVIVRNLKLILYQMIAPIPIINGIDPNDKMRTKWLKGYFGAYLDLFLKVFAIQLLARMVVVIPKISSDQNIGIIGSAAFLIALMVFVKIVPNLISKILGIEGLSDSFKSVKGMAQKALGVGAAAGGAAIGGALGAVAGGVTAQGGLGAKALGVLRGAARGIGSGSKKDVFGGSKSIIAANDKVAAQKAAGYKSPGSRLLLNLQEKSGIPSGKKYLDQISAVDKFQSQAKQTKEYFEGEVNKKGARFHLGKGDLKSKDKSMIVFSAGDNGENIDWKEELLTRDQLAGMTNDEWDNMSEAARKSLVGEQRYELMQRLVPKKKVKKIVDTGFRDKNGNMIQREEEVEIPGEVRLINAQRLQNERVTKLQDIASIEYAKANSSKAEVKEVMSKFNESLETVREAGLNDFVDDYGDALELGQKDILSRSSISIDDLTPDTFGDIKDGSITIKSEIGRKHEQQIKRQQHLGGGENS